MPMDWTREILPWSAPALTLIGWFLVNRQTNQREVRKDARSAADRCKQLAIDAAQVSTDYWAGKEDATAWRVKATLEELDTEIMRFISSDIRAALTERLAALADACTADDFDSLRMKPKPTTAPIHRTIAWRRQLFLQGVEEQFRRHF